MAGTIGFEPTTSRSQSERSTKLSYVPYSHLILLSISYIKEMACLTGLEPTTSWSVVKRSIHWATGTQKLYLPMNKAFGGTGRNRTDDNGVAVHGLTTWLRCHNIFILIYKNKVFVKIPFIMKSPSIFYLKRDLPWRYSFIFTFFW